MNVIRFTIASLAIVVALLAVDMAWLRYILLTHRSLLGFAYEGCDMAVLPMMNILAFGLFCLITRRGQRRRFLIGFEVSGLAAVLIFAACTRVAPDTMNGAFKMVLDPVWNLIFAWVPPGPGILQLAVGIFVVCASYGAPQLLIALGGGLLAQRVARRCRHSSATGHGPTIDTDSRPRRNDLVLRSAGATCSALIASARSLGA